MADTSTEPQQTQTQETTGASPFHGATAADLKIISKGGKEVQAPEPAPTPSPATTPSAAAPGDTPPATPTPVTPAATAVTTTAPNGTQEPVTAPESQIDFFEYLGEQTNGKYKSPEHIFEVLDEVEDLRKKLAERPQIEFPNDQAKQIYEYCQKFPGYEMSAARNYLHVQSLDTKTLTPKEKQFEAFALENNDIARDKAREFFEDMYEKKYGNGLLESDKTAQFNHDRETKKADEAILKMQTEFAKQQPSKQAAEQQTVSPEDLAAIEQNVSMVLEDFGGVTYNYFDDPNSAVNIALEEAEQQKFQEYLHRPQLLLQDLIESCNDKEGHFDYEIFRNAMFELMNRDKIREQTFAQGVTYGKLQQIMEIKNTKTVQDAQAPPPAAKGVETFKDAWINASKGKRVA
jgi:hypothetical protein